MISKEQLELIKEEIKNSLMEEMKINISGITEKIEAIEKRLNESDNIKQS